MLKQATVFYDWIMGKNVGLVWYIEVFKTLTPMEGLKKRDDDEISINISSFIIF